MIIIALNYNYMVNKFSVSGGEFIYTDKAFGKKYALICFWFLGLFYLAIVSLNATAYPMADFEQWHSEEMDLKLGKLIHLPNITLEDVK